MGSIWLTDLADACRSTGLRVIEEPGWRTRGHSGLATRPQTIVCHHTAASAKSYSSNPYPSLRSVRDGRPDLDGPLSQLGLQRDGAVRVIAAGRCWHAGATFHAWQNNDHSIGIEAEHDGLSIWPGPLRAAYVQLVAGLAEWYGVPVERVLGHKEVAKPLGRKTDPNFPMAMFRHDVARYTVPLPPATSPTEELTMTDVKTITDRMDKAEDLAGKRWRQTQDALTAHDRQEDGRYAELHTVHEKVDAVHAQLAVIAKILDAMTKPQ